MGIREYPDSFFRGIASSNFILNGHILGDAFQFDDAGRSDNFKELSINWNDSEEALELALTQRKSNGNLQFTGGVAKLDLSFVKMFFHTYIEEGTFSYEGREVPGNPYHGNLLISSTLNKQQRSTISGTLGLLAERNPIYPPKTSEE